MIFLFFFLLLSTWGIIVLSMPSASSVSAIDFDVDTTADERPRVIAYQRSLETSIKTTDENQTESFVKSNAIRTLERSRQASSHALKDLPCASHILSMLICRNLRQSLWLSAS
jgi:hypothetical protein